LVGEAGRIGVVLGLAVGEVVAVGGAGDRGRGDAGQVAEAVVAEVEAAAIEVLHLAEQAHRVVVVADWPAEGGIDLGETAGRGVLEAGVVAAAVGQAVDGGGAVGGGAGVVDDGAVVVALAVGAVGFVVELGVEAGRWGVGPAGADVQVGAVVAVIEDGV